MTSDTSGSDHQRGRTSGPWYYASDPSTSEFPAVREDYVPPRVPRGHPPQGHRRQSGGRGKIIAAISVVVAVAVAAAVFVVVRGHNSGHTTGFAPTGTTPEQDAQQTAAAFVKAWQTGDYDQAANYTDHPVAAKAALLAYKKYLHLRGLTGSVSAATAAGTNRDTVPLALNATVAVADGPTAQSAVWKYQSTLTAYQQQSSQLWYVAWQPDVVAPNLTATTHLAAVKVAPQVVSVGDANGTDLTSYHDAGLTNISGLLLKRGLVGHGKPGLYVQIETRTGQAVPNSQAVVVAPDNVGSLATTIDSRAEAAARSAVAMHPQSAMVAIQPSTGKILAIANNAGFNDFALTAAVAPGSTMKVLTATALINEGVLTASSPVECPVTYTVTGITYHNDNNESEPPGTPFINDFAASCNNAFSTQWQHLSGGGLASTARDYFGLNQAWNIGIAGLSASYFNAPADASGSELAQEAFGNGELTASPIAMASVAATVDAGAFHQPILVPGTAQVAAKTLPASTDSQLKQMMRAVVTSGTAAGIGLGPNVYAKTGTAQVQNPGVKPNSWFIAFDPTQDIAVACVVLNSGYGADFAGPEVKTFLNGF